jgi:hypothetical protein
MVRVSSYTRSELSTTFLGDDCRNFYIIDLGLAKKYLDEKGVHVPQVPFALPFTQV